MSRLEGSRWRLRRAREMRPAMEFEWVFFRLLFGAKRECRHFQGCGEETQIPLHTWRIISRTASAAPAASFLSAIRKLTDGDLSDREVGPGTCHHTNGRCRTPYDQPMRKSSAS
jgi:hypothetical protein